MHFCNIFLLSLKQANKSSTPCYILSLSFGGADTQKVNISWESFCFNLMSSIHFSMQWEKSTIFNKTFFIYFVLEYSWLTMLWLRWTAKWLSQNDSYTHMHVSILHQIPLPSRLPYSTELSSLCYTVGPCWLSILNIAVCTVHPKLPNYFFPASFPLATISLFSKSVSLFLFCN